MRESRGPVRINERGMAEVGNASRDRHRKIAITKNGEISSILKEKVVDVFKRVAPESWEILLSWLAYESERPLIDPKEELQTTVIKCAKKEGINFIYEKLCKLSGERIEKENRGE